MLKIETIEILARNTYMSMLDILVKSGGIEAIAGQLGIPKETARAGAEALLPAVVGGFKKQGQAQQAVNHQQGQRTKRLDARQRRPAATAHYGDGH